MNTTKQSFQQQRDEEDRILIALHHIQEINKKDGSVDVGDINDHLKQKGEGIKDLNLRLHKMAENGFAPKVIQVRKAKKVLPDTLKCKLNNIG